MWTPYLINSYHFVMMINITRPFCSVNFSKGSDFYTHTIIHILLAMVMFFRWQNDYGWLLILLLESHLLKQYCNYSIIAISIYVYILLLFNPGQWIFEKGSFKGGSLAFFRAASVEQVIYEGMKLFLSDVLLDHNGGLSLRSVAFLRVETTRCCWRPPFCGRETNTTCAANKRPVDLTTS